MKSLKFNEKPVAVLEQEFEISADVAAQKADVIEAELNVQTCSDEICLLPETLKFRIPLSAQ